jgi:cell wall-associated NlpC family hydrolase
MSRWFLRIGILSALLSVMFLLVRVSGPPVALTAKVATAPPPAAVFLPERLPHPRLPGTLKIDRTANPVQTGSPVYTPSPTGSGLAGAALAWAVTQAGAPYVWGGTGPYGAGYDCSGLVMMAYSHAGIQLPRTTWSMLSSPLLVRTYHPVPGDLAFFAGGEHVELYVSGGLYSGTTFGAHDYGSPVSYLAYGGSWVPYAFYHVV